MVENINLHPNINIPTVNLNNTFYCMPNRLFVIILIISASMTSITLFFPGTDFFFYSEKSNGKRSASEFDEVDDFGPETNVDAVDDPLSPTAKKYEENLFKDEGFEGHFNPFMEHQEKAALETDKLKKEDDEYEQKQSHEVEEEIEGINKLCKETKEKDEFLTEFQQQLEETQRIAREETPTPPADAGRSL